jgi:hypothetical protein
MIRRHLLGAKSIGSEIRNQRDPVRIKTRVASEKIKSQPSVRLVQLKPLNPLTPLKTRAAIENYRASRSAK